MNVRAIKTLKPLQTSRGRRPKKPEWNPKGGTPKLKSGSARPTPSIPLQQSNPTSLKPFRLTNEIYIVLCLYIEWMPWYDMKWYYIALEASGQFPSRNNVSRDWGDSSEALAFFIFIFIFSVPCGIFCELLLIRFEFLFFLFFLCALCSFRLCRRISHCQEEFPKKNNNKKQAHKRIRERSRNSEWNGIKA